LISTEPSLAYSEATTCITVAHQIFVLDVGEIRKRKEKGTKKEEDLQPPSGSRPTRASSHPQEGAAQVEPEKESA
jgi:hypothetical protein